MSLPWSPVRLLITSRDIHQPSGPSNHSTQSNKPPILPAVYIYSGRASSSVVHTETRSGKRACMTCRETNLHHSPAGQLAQNDSPWVASPWVVMVEYFDCAAPNLPAQYRHASVDRHETVCAALLHQLTSAERCDPRIFHLTFGRD